MPIPNIQSTQNATTRQQHNTLTSQLEMYSTAVKNSYIRDNKDKHSPQNVTNTIVANIEDMPAFKEAAEVIKNMARSEEDDVINIVISGYETTLLSPAIQVLPSDADHRMSLVDHIKRGCLMWTKRNDKVARFVLTNKSTSIGNLAKTLREYKLFHGIFAQDTKLVNRELANKQSKCKTQRFAKKSFPNLTPNMKYIMTRAILHYAYIYNKYNKPIRVHILGYDKEQIDQILAACVDCGEYNVENVFVLDVRHQPHIKTTPFPLDETVPMTHKDVEDLCNNAVPPHLQVDKKDLYHEEITQNMRDLQDSPHVSYDTLQVTKYYIDHNGLVYISGMPEEPRFIKRHEILVNTDYLDNLFHDVDHYGGESTHVLNLLSPSEEDPYHKMLLLYVDQYKAGAALRLPARLKQYWQTRTKTLSEYFATGN